jgi:hypothetical protein
MANNQPVGATEIANIFDNLSSAAKGSQIN